MKAFASCRGCLVLTTFLLINFSASAQFFKKLGKTLEGGVKTALKVATAPTEAVINTAKAVGDGNVKGIHKPFQEVGKEAGKTIGIATEVIAEPQRYFYSEAQKYASSISDEAEFIFDITTFNQRYSNELAYAGGQATANILQGKNPLQVAALPLAAAIHSARERFKDKAKPIPQDVKGALQGKFPKATLDRAKYAVGTIEITLPNFLNRVAIGNNENHAVTVDDIIVFYNQPDTFLGDTCHWIHELVHVDQFRRWGVEEFAWKFVNDYPVEKEANQQGSAIAGMPCNNGNEGLSGFAGGASSSITTKSSNYDNTKPSERFVAQCFFSNNQYPLYYLITETSKIMAIDVYNRQTHIGYATPPINKNFAWDFYLFSNYRVGVTADGRIWEPVQARDNFGRPLFNYDGSPMLQSLVIGYVQQI